jgi:hypothetical protein
VVRALALGEEHCCARKRAGLPWVVDLEAQDVDVHINISFQCQYNFPSFGTPLATALLMLADGRGACSWG